MVYGAVGAAAVNLLLLVAGGAAAAIYAMWAWFSVFVADRLP